MDSTSKQGETTIDGKTAAEHRADADESYAAREESFDRCDTDGFVSQWAHGLTGDLSRRKAELAENGGVSHFIVIVDGNGRVVPSRVVPTRFGDKRIVLDSSDNAIAWVAPSPALSGRTPRKLVELGLEYGEVVHPATAIMDGRGRGLSGTAWVAVKPVCGECGTIVRTIGEPCKCGHETPFEVVPVTEVNVYLESDES